MANLHKRSVQEAVNLSVGGAWTVATPATHGGTSNTDTIHYSVNGGTSQIAVYSSEELYFNFTITTTDVTLANDLILPAGTIIFITVPRGLGTTIYFNHLGKGSASTVRIVEI